MRCYTNIRDPFLGPPGVRRLLFCRGFLGFFGPLGVYYSLQYLPLSDAVILTFLAPLCITIAGSMLLKEKITKEEVLAGIISLLGAVLIARPPFIFGGDDSRIDNALESTAAQRIIAVGAVMIGVLGATGAFISIRAVGMRAHPMHHMAYYSFLSAVQSVIGAMITRTPIVLPTQPLYLGTLVMIGVFGFIAQLLVTVGYQIEAASRASMGMYAQIIFTLILERVLFGTVPGLLSILGMILILGSGFYAVMAKAKESGGHVRLDEDMGEYVEEG
ncbi:hypothetical protein APHAL10511_005536 [Amanita phalloides]|nr:hypothetical protein APHAL10511_005536 [Amanita phalloides]